MPSRRSLILTVVLAVPALAAVAFAEVATEALNTQHFRLHLAASRQQEGHSTAKDLEALWRQYGDTVGGMVSLHPAGRRLEVFAYEGDEGLRDLLLQVDDLRTDHRPFPGLLESPERFMVAVDGAGLLGTSDVAALFHSVSHLLHDVVLYDEGVTGSWWVREGIATYLMQTPYQQEQGFKLRKVRSSEGYITDVSPSGRVATSIAFAQEPKKSLEAMRDAYAKRLHIPLSVLLDHPADKPWPNALQRDRAAVESWVLIHFLLHGPEESLRTRLARYLDVERKGGGGSETFRRLVSGDLERLEPLVFRYARSIR